MTHDEFIAIITPLLDYEPDSANYDIFEMCKRALVDPLTYLHPELFGLSPDTICVQLAQHVTLQDIEDYDNGAFEDYEIFEGLHLRYITAPGNDFTD